MDSHVRPTINNSHFRVYSRQTTGPNFKQWKLNSFLDIALSVLGFFFGPSRILRPSLDIKLLLVRYVASNAFFPKRSQAIIGSITSASLRLCFYHKLEAKEEDLLYIYIYYIETETKRKCPPKLP